MNFNKVNTGAMHYMKQVVLSSFLLLLLGSCNNTTSEDNTTAEPAVTTPVINYTVAKYFVHDTSLFTEGLLFHNGQLFESTGSPEELPNTRSMIGITDLTTGKFTTKVEIDKSKYFGEGIVFLNGKLFQLTYKNQLCFIYDAKTFKKTGEFTYANKEGWSLTTDGTSLIMSDGTNVLTYIDPVKYTASKILSVTENGYPVDKLNELEFIKGFIYANIWLTDYIVKIDPATGNVVGKLDLGSLTNEAKTKNPNADVLNGIAYDSTTNKVYVTGKLWPVIYQVEFAH